MEQMTCSSESTSGQCSHGAQATENPTESSSGQSLALSCAGLPDCLLHAICHDTP